LDKLQEKTTGLSIERAVLGTGAGVFATFTYYTKAELLVDYFMATTYIGATESLGGQSWKIKPRKSVLTELKIHHGA